MSPQPRPATVDTVMEAWQRDAKPPTWAQIVAMKQEHAELRETAARQASLLRGCYARIDKLEKVLRELHDATRLVSIGHYDQEAHDIAVSRSLAALEKRHDTTGS